MVGLRGEGSMQRDKVGARQQIIQLVHELNLQGARPTRGEIRIERQDAQAKRDRAPAQLTPYPAHADDPKGLVEQLDTFEVLPVPFSAPQKRVRLWNFSRDGKE